MIKPIPFSTASRTLAREIPLQSQKIFNKNPSCKAYCQTPASSNLRTLNRDHCIFCARARYYLRLRCEELRQIDLT